MKKHNFPTFETKDSIKNAEDSPLFADYILKWLPEQIRISKLSKELGNALSDDTHPLSRHLEERYTHQNKKIYGQKTFKWRKNDRFFRIFLDIIDGKPSLLPKVLQIDMNKYRNVEDDNDWFEEHNDWCKPIHEQDITSKQKREFGELELATGILYFNPKSLIKSGMHKRTLAKWWINGDLGGGVSAISIVSSEYNKLKQKNYGKKDWEPSDEDLTHCMSKFTRKFNAYVSNCVNAYWYRAFHVGKNLHGTRQRRESYVIVRSYEKLVYCIMFEVLFGKEKIIWDEYFSRYPQLKGLFNNKFKTNTKHPYDCSAEFLKQYRINLGSFEEKSPDINIDQNLGKICAECGGNKISIVENKDYRYFCEECGVTDGKSLDARENKVLDEITTNQEKGTTYHKINQMKKLSRRRKNWQVRIDNFKDELIPKIESIKHLTELEKERIEAQIKKAHTDIRRSKEKSQSQE